MPDVLTVTDIMIKLHYESPVRENKNFSWFDSSWDAQLLTPSHYMVQTDNVTTRSNSRNKFWQQCPHLSLLSSFSLEVGKDKNVNE